MAENNKDTIETGRPGESRAVIRAIEETFLTGSVPADLPGLSDKKAQEDLARLLTEITATQRFCQSLSEGDLSQDLAVCGRMAGGLKALQSNLRHLTWQAGRVAEGDFSQRVEFLGEFAASFNHMAENLKKEEINRTRREEDLKRLNSDLSDEVAERKAAEEALMLANKKISMIASVTRHDIKNQLLALRGFLELTEEQVQDPVLLSYIAREKRAAETIARQVEFSKNYEDLGVAAPDWQDLSLVIRAARGGVALPENITISIDLPPVQVYSDRLIEKVFYNLMDNTLRHAGPVTMIRISFEASGSGAEIVYEDDGTGIAQSERLHLFRKGVGKNTGLGLFLSREILAITGLSIREEPVTGKGVRFVIAVPEGKYRMATGV